MSTTLKDWLKQTIAELEEERDAVPGIVNEDAAMALAAMKLALASLEAESKLSDFVASQESLGGEFEGVLTENIESLYVTSNPAVQITSRDLDEGFEKWYTRDECGTKSIAPEWFSEALKPVFLETWRACRAAMIQGADGNAPVSPDGWVACSERMPSPSTGVIVAAPWQSAPGGYAMKWATNCPGHPDADIDGWIIPGASWSPTHWMPLPAAPQQRG
ncbi:DUF551 domain-containing protein [Enterobacter hormaechei]|uniref:DUF551 domain-containing protein n=1 Tax=Enterobacter hormaechei TaxID=158836 RepID=UPI001D0C694E|nr:DUF551 domain-containing protein [Enterobacter hormaechei]